MTYQTLLKDIKSRIRQAQIKATLSVNQEMILLYWDIGRLVEERQQTEGWGAGVIPKLAKDIRNELPEIKGFSERNIGRMVSFYREYSGLSILPQLVAKLPETRDSVILPQAVAKLGANDINRLYELVASIPWGHNIVLIEKVKDLSTRQWYMEQAVNEGWGRDTLEAQIKNNSYSRQGQAVTNFKSKLPAAQSVLAAETLKDPYIFDFLTLAEPFHERELEAGLVQNLEKFLLELGAGFAFVGRQFHLEVSEQDFYIDLLFYHLKLRCFVVIELKKGPFKPEYAGKLNFYCSVVDDRLRHEQDQPTIGLILCQTKNKILAEYALRDIQKPIGVSEYELTKALPENLKSSLPSIEEIEDAVKSK